MFHMKMAHIFPCIHFISDCCQTNCCHFISDCCQKCSIRLLYAGMVICTDQYSTDECRYSISVSNDLYDIDANVPNLSTPSLYL